VVSFAIVLIRKIKSQQSGGLLLVAGWTATTQ